MTEIENAFFKQSTVFHVRITDPQVDIDSTFEVLDNLSDYLIVSQEGSDTEGKTRLHQHILIGLTKDFKKHDIKDSILLLYPNASGNQGHSIRLARNRDILASYVLKEGLFKYKGFTKTFIERAKGLSYSIKLIKKEISDLKRAVLDGKMSIDDYASELIEVKAKADQPIYMNHYKAHILSMCVKVGEISSRKISSNVLRQIRDPDY